MPTQTELIAEFSASSATRVWCPTCGWIDIESVRVWDRTSQTASFYCPACDKEGESKLAHGDYSDSSAPAQESTQEALA
jgi:hypothetical protein